MSATEPEKKSPPSPSASASEDLNAEARVTETTAPASEEKKKGRYDVAEAEKGPLRTFIAFFLDVVSLKNLAQMPTLICRK